MAMEIVSFPIKNGGSFHSFVYVYQRVVHLCRPLALSVSTGMDRVSSLVFRRHWCGGWREHWDHDQRQIGDISWTKFPVFGLNGGCNPGNPVCSMPLSEGPWYAHESWIYWQRHVIGDMQFRFSTRMISLLLPKQVLDFSRVWVNKGPGKDMRTW